MTWCGSDVPPPNRPPLFPVSVALPLHSVSAAVHLACAVSWGCRSISTPGEGGLQACPNKGVGGVANRLEVKFPIMMCSCKVWMRAKAWSTQEWGVGMCRVLFRVSRWFGSESF